MSKSMDPDRMLDYIDEIKWYLRNYVEKDEATRHINELDQMREAVIDQAVASAGLTDLIYWIEEERPHFIPCEEGWKFHNRETGDWSRPEKTYLEIVRYFYRVAVYGDRRSDQQ